VRAELCQLVINSTSTCSGPSKARSSICGAIARFPQLMRLDVRRLPGAHPVGKDALFKILEHLPSRVSELLLPCSAIRTSTEAQALQKILSRVRHWTCEIAQRTNGGRKSRPVLFPGVALIASAHIWRDFADAVVMLLGCLGPDEWHGVTVNGAALVRDGDVLLQCGGLVEPTLENEVWAVRSTRFEELEEDIRQRSCGSDAAGEAGTRRGLVHLEDNWEAWLDTVCRGPPGTRFFRGNCGWAPGQLENEVSASDWRVVCCPVQLLLGDIEADSLYSFLISATGGLDKQVVTVGDRVRVKPGLRKEGQEGTIDCLGVRGSVVVRFDDGDVRLKLVSEVEVIGQVALENM